MIRYLALEILRAAGALAAATAFVLLVDMLIGAE